MGPERRADRDGDQGADHTGHGADSEQLTEHGAGQQARAPTDAGQYPELGAAGTDGGVGADRDGQGGGDEDEDEQGQALAVDRGGDGGGDTFLDPVLCHQQRRSAVGGGGQLHRGRAGGGPDGDVDVEAGGFHDALGG
ncbi:MAG: hypothetical protein L0H96_24945 [Humibacillus sp.]|nr:hypothetical protein [Humibacillus sp.]